MRLILVCGLLIVSISVGFAQTAACTRLLGDAEEAFDQGRLLDVKDMLLTNNKKVDCFSSFSKDEQIRAEKLLVKVHLFTDNVPEAEKALVDLLIADKEHQLAKDDPSELHFLYSQFKTEPIFRLGARLSVNKSLPSVIRSHNTFQSTEKQYNENAVNNPGLGVGFSFEVLIERHIKNGIEIGLGPQLRVANYQVEGDFLEESGLVFYNVTNQSTMLRIPLLGRYNFNYDKKNIEGIRLNKMWYVFGGASYDLMMNAKYINTDRTGGTAFTLTDENSSLTDLDQVATSNVSIFAGAGVKLRMGRAKVDFLTFELRYDNSLFNYTDPDNRYANQDVAFDIGHVEDDLTLNTVSISVGYTRSFYKPSKRKQYR